MRKIFSAAVAAFALAVATPAAAAITVDFTATNFSKVCIGCVQPPVPYTSLTGTLSYDLDSATNAITMTAFSLNVGATSWNLSNIIYTMQNTAFRIGHGTMASLESSSDFQLDFLGFTPTTGQSSSFQLFYTVPAGTSYDTFLGHGQATVSGSGVPEPATWAMMLLGFGGIGFAVRRKRPALLQQTA